MQYKLHIIIWMNQDIYGIVKDSKIVYHKKTNLNLKYTRFRNL